MIAGRLILIGGAAFDPLEVVAVSPRKDDPERTQIQLKHGAYCVVECSTASVLAAIREYMGGRS